MHLYLNLKSAVVTTQRVFKPSSKHKYSKASQNVRMQVVSKENNDGSTRKSTSQISSAQAKSPSLRLSVFVRAGQRFTAVLARERKLLDAHMLKLSPQPHVPLMLGLLKTNSLESFDSTKSISVPRRVSWAFFSINTLTPARHGRNSRHTSRLFVKG